MGTIRVKRVDGPAKKKKKLGKRKGPPGPPRSGGVGKKGKGMRQATAIVKPKPTRRADAPLATRTARVERAHERLERVLNFDNCPADYASLKFEARYLSGLSTYSFALMAQRLTRIRDEKLYEAEYPDFRSFVDAEINLSLPTVYKYMQVYSEFGELIESADEGVTYSRLLPVLPLLRDARSEQVRARLKNESWKIARTKSGQEANAALEALRKRFAPREDRSEKKSTPSRLEREISRLEAALPSRPTRKEVALLAGLVERIRSLL